MKERDEKTARESGVRLKRLLCKRTGVQIEPGEHERCPYCFGRLADIETGSHEAFCDYREGIDPVSFGFPDENRRLDKS